MNTYNLYIIDHSKSENEANYIEYAGDDTTEYTFNKDLVDTVFSTKWGYTSYKIPVVIDNLLKLLLEDFDLSENIEFYRSLGVYFNYETIEALRREEDKDLYYEFGSIGPELSYLNEYFTLLQEDRANENGDYKYDLIKSIKFSPSYGDSRIVKNPFVTKILMNILENGINELVNGEVTNEYNFVQTVTGIKEDFFYELNEVLGDVKRKAKFIGVFSHLFQIPVIAKDVAFTKLEEGKDIDEYIDSDVEKSIRSAIKRREKLNQ